MSTKNKSMWALIIIATLICSLGLAACGKSDDGKSNKPKAKKVIVNSLTGQLGSEEDAINKRITGIVVENHPDARPQWGIDDTKYAPDIIVQGEVEYGITRMLWMFADYSNLPEIVGPVRSARPPFIKFASLFNALFIHWGMSESSGAYNGADYYFNQGTVEHIDEMNYGRKNSLFDRALNTGRDLEHTGIIHGEKLEKALEDEGFNLKLDKSKTSMLSFNKKAKKLSENSCKSVEVKFSDASQDILNWVYNDEDKLYHNDHFATDLTRTNLLIISDTTSYVSKESGATYCEYALEEGQGKLISSGRVLDINWKNDNGKLKLFTTDKEGKELVVKLNPGKTWVGWISANNGGNVVISE